MLLIELSPRVAVAVAAATAAASAPSAFSQGDEKLSFSDILTRDAFVMYEHTAQYCSALNLISYREQGKQNLFIIISLFFPIFHLSFFLFCNISL
jgi:hypothetical protein